MKRYKDTKSGREIEGHDAEAVVLALGNGSPFTADKPVQQYMGDVARRVRATSGATVPTDDADQFLAGLCAAGYLTKLA